MLLSFTMQIAAAALCAHHPDLQALMWPCSSLPRIFQKLLGTIRRLLSEKIDTDRYQMIHIGN